MSESSPVVLTKEGVELLLDQWRLQSDERGLYGTALCEFYLKNLSASKDLSFDCALIRWATIGGHVVPIFTEAHRLQILLHELDLVKGTLTFINHYDPDFISEVRWNWIQPDGFQGGYAAPLGIRNRKNWHNLEGKSGFLSFQHSREDEI